MPDGVNAVEEKVVVMTGASSGIGESIDRRLGAKGARVVMGARRGDRLEAIVGEIRGAGGEAIAHEVDVSSREGGRGWSTRR